MDLSSLAPDASGLLTVVVQDRHTGEVRMVAHATRQAVELTLTTGEAHFWSRSRQKLWRKGEESGNTIAVAEVWVDCDADTLVYLSEPRGPSCHTGARNCLFRRLGADGALIEGGLAAPTLVRLWDELEARRSATSTKSYTRSLLDGGAPKIGAKLREEADELARALADESEDRVVSECADVVYHALVALLARGLSLRDVEAELARRSGTSGLAEKAARPPK